MIKRKMAKSTYTAEEMCKLHNYYRIGILLLVTLFLFIMHHYGVADNFVKDITGGQIAVSGRHSFISFMFEILKYLAGSLVVIYGLTMGYDKYIKKQVAKRK